MPGQWITAAEAAAVVGCHRHTIDRHVLAGRIARRYPLGRKTPTLDRKSVDEFAVWWRTQRAEAEERRVARQQRTGPPADGDEWLSCPAAASLLGVSPQYLGRAAGRGRIAATRRGTRWWFRRRDVERYAYERARALDDYDYAPA